MNFLKSCQCWLLMNKSGQVNIGLKNTISNCRDQCCGSVTCWYASGSESRIRTTDFRIRILLFSTMAENMLTKISFFSRFLAFYFFVGPFMFSYIKVKKMSPIVEIKGFLSLFAC